MPRATKFYKEEELVFETIYSDRIIDLTGLTFSRLTVLGFAKRYKRTTYWYVKCVCEVIFQVDGSSLKSGATKSCGCKSNDFLTRHKQSRTIEYQIYHGAKKRCTNTNSLDYARYGKIGIEFNFNSFEEFIDHIKLRPSKKYSLDRIDNLKGYEIGNVRWAKQKTQSNNQKRNIILKIKNIEKSLTEWCEQSELQIYSLISQRLYKGWCPICAFETWPYEKPPQNCNHEYSMFCNRSLES